MISPTDPIPPAADPSPRPKPRRRWWSLSVRGLMVLVLLVGGLVGWEAGRVTRMRRAIATLERPVKVPIVDLGPLATLLRGAASGTDPETVRLTYQDLFEGWAWLKGPATGRVVGWLRRAVGDDHFRRVEALKFARRPMPTDWDAIAALGTVERLDFAGVNVTDDDLARLGECSRLRDLDLSDSPITDRTLAVVGKLPALQALDVGSTHTSSEGAAALGGLVALEELTLRDDVDADVSLAHLGKLPNLRSLSVGRLSDRGLAALRGNDRLTTLSFTASNVTDAGWAVVTACRDLRVLRAKGRRVQPIRSLFGIRRAEVRPLTLSAGAVGDLGRLTHLEELEAGDAADADWGPPLARLVELRRLDLHETDNTTLAAVGGLAQLELLSVDGDRITDAGLAPLGRLTNLASLGITSPGVTDAGLQHLAPLTRLRGLVLMAHVTPDGVAALRSSLPGLGRVHNFQIPKMPAAWP